MKVINRTESVVYLDDIDVLVMYTRTNQAQEIDDKLARKSRTLTYALATKMLVDVTDGIPAVMPSPEPPKSIVPDPDSPYFKRQAMLADSRIPLGALPTASRHPPKQPLPKATLSSVPMPRYDN